MLSENNSIKKKEFNPAASNSMVNARLFEFYQTNYEKVSLKDI